jgi:two-component system, HptB-dependent secretion and biofilm response regulator
MEQQAHLAFEIFDHADHGIVLVDQQNHVQMWNQWMVEQTEIKKSEVIKQPTNVAILASIFPAKILTAINNALLYGRHNSFPSVGEVSYSLDVKVIILDEQRFCLLNIFDSTPMHDSDTKAFGELIHQHSQELALTSHLLEKISGMNKFLLPGLSVWQQEKDSGNFSGDIVLSAPRPSGGVNILLGDFVGRGLPAAVGALPVAEVFYGMTEKGFGLSDIIEEINQKLLFVLPEGLFCAACLMELEEHGKMLAVWNGGLPDVLIIDQQANIKDRVPSSHIPLGIYGTNKVDLDAVFIEVDAGDKVVFYTDGVINAENTQGEKFGSQNLERFLSQGNTFQAIQQSLLEHIADTNQVDDISLAELDILAMQSYDGEATAGLNQISLPPAHWQAEFEFSAQVLRTVDLVPLLVNVLIHIQAPHEHRQRIYTVLAEMFSNALDHGVLQLQSALKKSANGFTEYYAQRAQRLTELENANINISLLHRPCDDGGILTIRVEDSGDGFDYNQHAKDLAENKTLCGRGEGLLKKLCKQYEYSGKGNVITADYHWTA